MQRQGEISLNERSEAKEINCGDLSIEKWESFSYSEKINQDTKLSKKTLFFDCLRYIFQGFLDKELHSMILLMAIRIFHMPVGYKAILTSIGFLGMIFTPITQQLANRSRWSNMQISAIYFALIGISFFCAAFSTSWASFFIFMALAKIFDKQQIPLMIGTYLNNYRKVNRGFKVGKALACMPVGGIIFSQLSGYFSDKNPNHFNYLLFLASFIALCCAFCFWKIPTRKIVLEKYPPLLDNFKFLAKDHLFAVILFFYSFIAIANQMTLPLRLEYLANHRHSLDVSYGTIIAIFGVIQPLASIFSGPIWGRLYDHVSLITMRQYVTACFIIGIPLFFATDNLNMIYLASVLLGIGRSGGVIFWSLWILNVAPKDKVSEYMSANTAIIGLRDALAPFLGYGLLHYTNPFTVGVIAFSLLVISMLGFEWINRHPIYQKRIIK